MLPQPLTRPLHAPSSVPVPVQPSLFGANDGHGHSLVYYFALPEGWEPSQARAAGRRRRTRTRLPCCWLSRLAAAGRPSCRRSCQQQQHLYLPPPRLAVPCRVPCRAVSPPSQPHPPPAGGAAGSAGAGAALHAQQARAGRHPHPRPLQAHPPHRQRRRVGGEGAAVRWVGVQDARLATWPAGCLGGEACRRRAGAACLRSACPPTRALAQPPRAPFCPVPPMCPPQATSTGC